MGAIVPWTEEREQELRRLFLVLEEGAFLSHSYIAELMRITRNAVIGKIRRLGLKRDPLIGCMGVDHRIIDPVQQRAEQVSRVPTTYGRAGPPRAARVMSGPGEYTGAPSPHATQILEIRDDTCKFPVGHVGHEGFHFCGDAVGPKKPYCAYHGQICYVPLKERQKQYPARL